MESSKFIIFLCVIGAVKCLYSNIDPSAQIADTAILENYINVGPGVIIGPYAFFGSYATINQYSSIGKNSKIESYVRIGEYTVIENDVTMNPYCTIGNRNTFKPGSILYNNVMTADNVIIDKKAQLFPYSSIAYGVKIGEGVICDDYSLVGLYVDVHPKAYVGNYVIVQKNAVVSEFAVLQKYVEIPEGATVKQNQIVIRKPSSYEFYLTSDPVESIPDGMVKIASQSESDTISPDFNKLLLQLIESDLSKLSYDCKHSNFPNRPENLRRTISLYLIRYHGLDSYNENRQHLDDYNSDRVKQLQNELHLGPNPQKNILTTEVQKNFIKLLAIVEDMDRRRRIEDDTVCIMIANIQNDERDVTIADRSNKALFAPY